MADVLFGDVSPSGKLPVSWPRATGQLPLYYNSLPSGRPTLLANRFTLHYIDEAHTPLYPFGWGLGYAGFAYTDPVIDEDAAGHGDSLNLSVTVTNRGSRAGQEVVQLYTRDPIASRSRPLRELKAFEKIPLAAGGSQAGHPVGARLVPRVPPRRRQLRGRGRDDRGFRRRVFPRRCGRRGRDHGGPAPAARGR